MVPEARWLALSAALLFLVSSLAGFALLVLLQPWGQPLARRIASFRNLVSGHVDWVLLAAMQLGAGFAITLLGPPPGRWVAWLMIGGAWLNATPYFARGLLGINAMVYGGGAAQRLAAATGLVSSSCIVAAWSALLLGWVNS